MDIGLKTDVHSHILPGVDDGSPDIGHSLKIISGLRELGIRRLTFTPHVSRSIFKNPASDLREQFSRFKEQIPSDFSGLELHLAAEYMIDEFFDETDERLLFPDGHILIEMSYYERSRTIRETVYKLYMEGLRPVLAHPERYVFYQRVFDKKKGIEELKTLKDMGCQLQLNVLSLTGAYGKKSLDVVRWLLDNRMYDFIGTDIHSAHQTGHYNGFKVNSAQMDRLCELAYNNDKLYEKQI